MANLTSKELIIDLFQLKELPRFLFVPWVCSFAAKLEQISVKEMLSDPSLLSRSLQNAQKLFGYDGIINVFDPSLEAEACGCEIRWGGEGELPEVVSHPLREGIAIKDLDISEIEKKGRLPVVLEATKRISVVRGKEVALIGVVTGPLTLARHLKGEVVVGDLESHPEEVTELIELARKVVLKLCRIYCELGVDVVLIAEEMFGQMHSRTCKMVASFVQTARNIMGYYNAYPVILTRKCSEDHIDPICQLGADGVVLSGDIDYNYIRNTVAKYDCCFGASIPSSVLQGTQAEVRDVVRERLALGEKRGFFLSTEWEVPYDTSVANMHEVMKALH